MKIFKQTSISIEFWHSNMISCLFYIIRTYGNSLFFRDSKKLRMGIHFPMWKIIHKKMAIVVNMNILVKLIVKMPPSYALLDNTSSISPSFLRPVDHDEGVCPCAWFFYDYQCWVSPLFLMNILIRSANSSKKWFRSMRHKQLWLQ